MALRIWEEEYDNPLSQGDMTYPVIFKAAPGGDSIERRLFLRHDDLSGNNPESSYGVSVGGADIYGTDESTWIQVAEDIAGSPDTYSAPGDPMAFGDVLGGEITPFWVKVTTPNDAQYGMRSDIKLQVTADSSNIDKVLSLATGTYNNCIYDLTTNKITVTDPSKDAWWITEWINTPPEDIYSLQVTATQIPVISYRSSTDGTDATASAWFSSTSELDTLHSYVQMRVFFIKVVPATGLRREVYSGTAFNTLIGVDEVGAVPWSSNPGSPWASDNFSTKYIGHFYAEAAGYYRFRYNTDDGGRIYVDGSLRGSAWFSGADNWSDTGSIYFNAGTYHSIEFHHYDSSSGQKGYAYITKPNASERAVVVGDFVVILSGSLTTKEISKAVYHYDGNLVRNFDTQIFDGPDVPELIAPVSGYKTQLFSPELTVYVRNCDEIEWQMDMVTTFDSANLVQWITPATIEENNISNPPGTTRPPGIWYWRARGIKDGMYSAWSDYRIVEILPLLTNPEFIYLHRSVVFEVFPAIQNPQFTYLNANTGFELIDTIFNSRFIYQNVNIDVGIGEIIYPLLDKTKSRKLDFEGDEDFGS